MLVPVLVLKETASTPTDIQQALALQGMPVNCQQRFVNDIRHTGFGMQCRCCLRNGYSSPGQCRKSTTHVLAFGTQLFDLASTFTNYPPVDALVQQCLHWTWACTGWLA